VARVRLTCDAFSSTFSRLVVVEHSRERAFDTGCSRDSE